MVTYFHLQDLKELSRWTPVLEELEKQFSKDEEIKFSTETGIRGYSIVYLIANDHRLDFEISKKSYEEGTTMKVSFHEYFHYNLHDEETWVLTRTVNCASTNYPLEEGVSLIAKRTKKFVKKYFK
jgi:hypothetical protein